MKGLSGSVYGDRIPRLAAKSESYARMHIALARREQQEHVAGARYECPDFCAGCREIQRVIDGLHSLAGELPDAERFP